MPSQESLDENRGSCSPNAGHPSEKGDSPELPVFGNGSPNRRIGHPKSSPAHDLTSRTRVRVLPTVKSPERGNKLKSPPPIVKPKPTIPKKPQSLKQTSASEKLETTTTEQPPKSNEKQESSGKEEEKSKTKKASRFPRLHGFGGGLKKDSNKKERGGREGGGGGEEGEREKSPPGVSGAGTRDLDMGLEMGEWEVPGDGRESPLLQGRKG